MVETIESGADEVQRWAEVETIATAICIGYPGNVPTALPGIRETGVTVVAVTDDEITDAQRPLAGEGVGVQPASAASVAGLRSLCERGEIVADEDVAVLTTVTSSKIPTRPSRRASIRSQSPTEPTPSWICWRTPERTDGDTAARLVYVLGRALSRTSWLSRLMASRDTVIERRGIDGSRRAVLATCVSALGMLAGCGGDGEEDSPAGGATPTDDPGRESTDSATDGSGGNTGDASTRSGDGGRPSRPSSYRLHEIAPADESDPVASVEAPEGQPFTVGLNLNGRWEVSFGEDRITVVPMPKRIDDVENFASGDGVTDVTEEYDVPDGWRVVVGAQADDIPTNVQVGNPTSDGPFLCGCPTPAPSAVRTSS